MSTQDFGNRTENTSLVDLLKVVKTNIFKTLKVAEVATVEEVLSETDRRYKCSFITNTQVYVNATALQGLTIAVGNKVLIIFTDTDFRAALEASANGRTDTSTQTITYHQKTSGVIVGLL